MNKKELENALSNAQATIFNLKAEAKQMSITLGFISGYIGLSSNCKPREYIPSLTDYQRAIDDNIRIKIKAELTRLRKENKLKGNKK